MYYKYNFVVPFFTLTLLYLFITLLSPPGIEGSSATKEIENVTLLNQFRLTIKDLMTQDYMNADGYLERWLKLYKNNLDLTVDKFKENLAWRLKNNIDNVLLENTTKLDDMFSYGIEGIDKDGRPVTWTPVGKFNLRAVTLNREDHILKRQLFRVMELTEHIMFTMGNESGFHNISRAISIFDMNGFNLRQSACIRCVPLMLELFTTFEANYPLLFYKLYFINSPALLKTTWNFIKGFLAEPTKETVQLFTHDKTKWGPALQEQIPIEELSEEFGGTKSKKVINGKTLSTAAGRKLVADEWLEKILKLEQLTENNK